MFVWCTSSVLATEFDGDNIERGPEGNASIPIPLLPIIVLTYNSTTCNWRPIDDADNITVYQLPACSTTTDMVYTATLVLSSTTQTPPVIKAQVNAEAEVNT